MRLALVPFVTLLCACASPPPPAPPPAPTAQAAAPAPAAAPAVETADTPYTAAQIRDASPTGRRIVLKMEEPGQPPVWQTIEFVKSDAAGADLRSTSADEKGAVLKTSTSRATWEELRSHAAFPKAKAEVKHRTISVPMGTLACTVYKVTEGEGDAAETTTYYFADTLPGPPVFHFTEKGGKRIRSSTMEPPK